jgi:aspartyl-tRNA(Asn)/glutamyl-tRNA(Gln) amidotransferase subunit B
MDTSELDATLDGIIAANADVWAELVAGDDKARKKKSGFFVGLVMQATKGQADGKAVNKLLAQKIAAAG